MARKMTVYDLASVVSISILQYNSFTLSLGRKEFHCFSFDLKCEYQEKEFNWTINRTYKEFNQLLRKVTRHFANLPGQVPSLPSHRVFERLLPPEQIELTFCALRTLLRHMLFSRDTSVLEFIELSSNSFVADKKYKEGYLMKIGSGRHINQQKLWNCYNHCHRNHPKWVRVSEFGVEYSRSHTDNNVAEVLHFSPDFTVTKGKADTGFSKGIKIQTAQHNVILRCVDTKQRDEFEAAISETLGNTEYFIKDIRFDSSFIIRPYNTCNWYVDAENYFSDVFFALKQAKNYVYITDWWMSPELFLKRPAIHYPESQLVELLGELADNNVDVYVHMYKELSVSLTINSLHTKRALLRRSDKIHIMRHPNIGIKGGVFLWSHHEKMIVVDGEIGFLGGLDLCYGRYDNNKHSLTDIEHPHIWNLLDYSNVRVADFTRVDQWERDSVQREVVPRMPWHDIALSVKGTIVRDLEMHFRDLWNHAVRDITGDRKINMIIPLHNKAAVQRLHSSRKNITSVQINEEEIQLQLKDEEKDFIDPLKFHMNFLSRLQEATEMNEAIPIESMDSHQGFKESSLSFFQPLISSFVQKQLQPRNEEDLEAALKEKQAEESKEATEFTYSKDNIFASLIRNVVQYERSTEGGSCQCQLLRSAGLWSIGKIEPEHSIHNAYVHLIGKSQRFIYIENQFFISSTAGLMVNNQIVEALKARILRAYEDNEAFKVIVVLPLLPGFEGSVDDPNASVLRVQLYYEYKTISRGSTSLYEQLGGVVPNPKDYIRFYGLRTHALLQRTPVTEMIYVHSKLMIVDDRYVIVGSANINDRSMAGNRDSELVMLVEDKRKKEIILNGEPFEVAHFANSLRMNIFAEHSGEGDPTMLVDVFSEEFAQCWERRAKKNTNFYRVVFRCYPDDRIKRIEDIKKYTKRARLDQYSEKLEEVIGHIVNFPARFLEHEDLKLKVSNKEYYLPDTTFT